ncbi:MAG: glycosyltransferase [Micromonosporaceae bacterium]
MRIALICMQPDPFAAARGRRRQVAELARAIARAGHEVRVYALGEKAGESTSAFTPEGVTVEYGPAAPPDRHGEPPREPFGESFGEAPDSVPELMSHVDAFGTWLGERWRDGWRPDVVHAHFWCGGLAAVGAARDLGLPVVQTYHSLGSVRRRWHRRPEVGTRDRVRMERALGRSVARVVALCNSEATELTRLGVSRDAISVVPFGVDTQVFCPRGEAEPADPGRLRILAVGRSRAPNGFAELLSSLRLVPAAELVIAGGPPPERLDTDPWALRLRGLAEEVGVADRVRLLGAVGAEQMPRWYRSAQVYASTSPYSFFGLPAVEAMACGAPVVAYAVGGHTESVVHRVTGLLVHPHDVRAFGTTLRRLLGSEVDRFAYADAGVDRAQVRYDWRRVVTDLERVYERVRGH